jgi:drug/metabolite transporter (DMT)-like permease
MMPPNPRVTMGLAPRLWAIAALVGANVIWGTTFVATKPLLDRIPPITIAFGRFAIALVILLPLLSWSRERPILNRTTALMGFVGVLLVYVFQNLGLAYTGAANGALIHGGIPAFTAIIAAAALGEQLDRSRVAGLGLSCIGVMLIVLRGSGVQLGLSALGDGLVFLSALALAWYLVLGRRAFPEGSSLALVGGVAMFGFLFLAPASGVELMVRGMEYPTVRDVAALVYLGAAASALAFVLWAHGLRYLEAGQAANFSNLGPFVGVVVAALLLKEAVSTAQIAGGLLILGGVWLTARPTGSGRVADPIIDVGLSRAGEVVKGERALL